MSHLLRKKAVARLKLLALNLLPPSFVTSSLLTSSLLTSGLLTIVLAGMQAGAAHAALVPTESLISPQYEASSRTQPQFQERLQKQSYLTIDRQQLLQSLESEQLTHKMMALGIEPEPLKQRISLLTDDEIQLLNAEIQDLPAGAGIGSTLLTIFIIFVITDAACATDIFTFVKCIR